MLAAPPTNKKLTDPYRTIDLNSEKDELEIPLYYNTYEEKIAQNNLHDYLN